LPGCCHDIAIVADCHYFERRRGDEAIDIISIIEMLRRREMRAAYQYFIYITAPMSCRHCLSALGLRLFSPTLFEPLIITLRFRHYYLFYIVGLATGIVLLLSGTPELLRALNITGDIATLRQNAA